MQPAACLHDAPGAVFSIRLLLSGLYRSAKLASGLVPHCLGCLQVHCLAL